MTKKIIVRFIIQIAGKPKEKVMEALDIVLKKLKNEKKFKVVESFSEEPVLNEKTTLFAGFIEVVIRFEIAADILEFILDYTPTSVEVEEPEKLEVSNNEFTGILNDMSNSILDLQNKVRQLNAYVHMQNKKIEELGGSIDFGSKSKK